MAKKKTPITVYLKRANHKTQPWSFYIDDIGPGPKVTVRERYSTKRNAKVGSLRKLKAVEVFGNKSSDKHSVWQKDGREIIFKTK